MGDTQSTAGPTSFVWYELMTTDLDGASAFYGDVVGWRIDAGGDQPGADHYRMIMRSDGGANGGALHLTDAMCDEGARPCWMGYFHADDVDARIAEIVADGGKVLLPAQDIPQGRFAMVTDPQGVAFYVMTPVPPPGWDGSASDVYDRYAPQHVSWNELVTEDLDGAKAFYAKHFGFEFNSSMPMGEFGDYCFIDQGGQGIGAVMKRPPFVPVAGWSYYIRVDSVTRAVSAIEAGGGKVLRGPHEVPGGDWTVNGIDPQGAAFAIVGAKGE